LNAIQFDGELKLVRDAPIPRRTGEPLVQVLAAGICSTDLEIVKGYAGFKGTLGHEFVGRVIESNDPALFGKRVAGEINCGCGACGHCRSGDQRHCPTRTVLGIKNRDGAFAEYLSLPETNLVRVPDVISDEEAVFIEPLAAALHILDQTEVEPSTQVAIIGDGKLAQLIVIALVQTRCRMTVIGKHDEKLRLAKRNAPDACLLRSAQLCAEHYGRFDCVVEASGSAAGLETALKLARPAGTIVLKSTHVGETSFDASAIVVNELNIVGSRCGRLSNAIDFISRFKPNLRNLISERLSLDQGLTGFALAENSSSMKVILQVA